MSACDLVGIEQSDDTSVIDCAFNYLYKRYKTNDDNDYDHAQKQLQNKHLFQRGDNKIRFAYELLAAAVYIYRHPDGKLCGVQVKIIPLKELIESESHSVLVFGVYDIKLGICINGIGLCPVGDRKLSAVAAAGVFAFLVDRFTRAVLYKKLTVARLDKIHNALVIAALFIQLYGTLKLKTALLEFGFKDVFHNIYCQNNDCYGKENQKQQIHYCRAPCACISDFLIQLFLLLVVVCFAL